MIKTSDVFWLLRLYGVSETGLALFLLKIFIDSAVIFINMGWLLAPAVISFAIYPVILLSYFLFCLLNSNFTVYLIKGLKDDKRLLFHFAMPMIVANLCLLMIGWSIAKIIH